MKAQTSLFQMRYDSLLNSEKWLNDSPKGSGTPCFRPTQWSGTTVVLLIIKSPFSNSGFSGLDQQFFLKFDFVVFMWPKLNI